MKKKMIIAGLIALTITVVMFVSIVAAAPSISTIAVSGPGVVWQFNPNPAYGEVTEVQAIYYLDSSPLVPRYDLTPINTIIKDDLVTLVFAQSDTASLAGHVSQTAVSYYQIGNPEQPFVQSGGPGFAWGRTR